MRLLKTHKVARWFLYVDTGDGRGGCYVVLATESEIRRLRVLQEGQRMFLQGRWVMRVADGLLAVPQEVPIKWLEALVK